MTGWRRASPRMMDADQLVLLSDVDGLYTADPARDAAATHIPEVAAITPEIEAMAGGIDFRRRPRRHGVQADRRARSPPAPAATSSSPRAKASIRWPRSRNGARHTLFRASVTPAAARKRWIAGVLKPRRRAGHRRRRGQGAGRGQEPAARRHPPDRWPLRARRRGAGARTSEGREIARGLVAYNASDAERIAGKRTVEIEAILGYRGRDEMIHRDDLALTE